MIPSNLIFINAAPHDDYFIWQEEVMITNFLEHGIKNIEILVWYPKEGLNKNWQRLVRKYRQVKFFFYEDQGIDLALYIPQLRPQILKMHFDKFRDRLKDKMFFYHDADIIFNFLPKFVDLCADSICYQSDTSGYLDYTYLCTKEQAGGIPENTVIEGLAQIGGITKDTIQSYDKNSGGAQYMLKQIDSEFWADVEKDCLAIRKYLLEINKTYFPSESAGFQSWCADMWAVNFNLWKRGKVTQTTAELDFSWATDAAATFHKKPIFHNAGVTATNKMLFYKGNWIDKSPIGKNIRVSRAFASYHYVEAIKKVK